MTAKPICAFDVFPDQPPVEVASSDPLPDQGATYRWLHFDLNDPGFKAWARRTLPVVAASALTQEETRPRCAAVESGLILNLRGVNQNPGADAEDMVSLRMWVSPGLVVSARMRKVWAIDDIRLAAVNGQAPSTQEEFLARVAHGLSNRIEAVSVGLVDETDILEEHVFDGVQDTAVRLASLRQAVIKLRRFLRPQSDALHELAQGAIWPLEPATQALLWETQNRAKRTIEELDSMFDRLMALQDHLDVQTATALGRNSYVLSVVAAIFLPLGFLTGLFGINVGGMPLMQSPWGFAIIAVASVLIGCALYGVFRWLKWL